MTGDFIVLEPPIDDGTRLLQHSIAPENSFTCLNMGDYTPVSQFPSPHFIFSASNPSLNSPSHFFISVSLSFPN